MWPKDVAMAQHKWWSYQEIDVFVYDWLFLWCFNMSHHVDFIVFHNNGREAKHVDVNPSAVLQESVASVVTSDQKHRRT